VAGTGGIAVLGDLLNGRKWWGGRRPAALRATAARALGMIGSEEARAELEKAAADRAAPVKSAVRVAIRSLEADSGDRLLAMEGEPAGSIDLDVAGAPDSDLDLDLDDPDDREARE